MFEFLEEQLLSNKKEKTIYVVLDTYPNSEESITQKNNNNEEFDLIGLIVSDANNGVEIKKIDKRNIITQWEKDNTLDC